MPPKHMPSLYRDEHLLDGTVDLIMEYATNIYDGVLQFRPLPLCVASGRRQGKCSDSLGRKVLLAARQPAVSHLACLVAFTVFELCFLLQCREPNTIWSGHRCVL